MRIHLLKYILPLALVSALHAQPLVVEPGFENGASGWKDLYIPSDSTDKGCQFSLGTEDPHAGKFYAILKSEDYGRMSISPRGMPLPVQPGDRYKLTVWVKAGDDFQVESGQPGILVRVDMLGENPSVGVVTANWQGKTELLQAGESVAAFVTPSMPKVWTQIETEFTVPEGAYQMRASIFFWRAIGRLYIDDFQIERIYQD